MRKPIIAGNWKMHKTVAEATNFAEDIKGRIPSPDSVDAVICAPALVLHRLAEVTKGSDVKIGAQNMHWEEKGAYTGEISPTQLKDTGIDYVILGHSERRELFCESDEMVNKKVQAAISYGLIPIVCVGETLQEREAGETEVIVQRQVKKAFEQLNIEQVEQAVIAYEPIWAIGTGRTASPEDANAVCKHIRHIIADLFSSQTAEVIRIQYGGSVNSGNIAEIMSQPHIDGALVGGASLEPMSFLQLLEAVHRG